MHVMVLKSSARTDEVPVMGTEEWAQVFDNFISITQANKDSNKTKGSLQERSDALCQRRTSTTICIKRNHAPTGNPLHLGQTDTTMFQASIGTDMRGALQYAVERMVVLSLQSLIGADSLPEALINSNAGEVIHVKEIISLKEAQKILEEKLLAMAQKKFKTTTAIGASLGMGLLVN